MNKFLLIILTLIIFCQCNDNTNQSESNEVETNGNRHNLDDGKPYHADRSAELIPTQLIEDKYDGFIVGDNVRLRAEADVKSDMIAELPNGLLLNIVGKTAERSVLFDEDVFCDKFGHPWIEVETIDGQKGWIFGKFVYKVENLEHQKINEYQGELFDFNYQKYRFGYAMDFSHPAVYNGEFSSCNDFGMLFFHKAGENKIRPIIAEKNKIGLKENKKGFWHFVGDSDVFFEHLYEMERFGDKIRFKYHACTYGSSRDGVIEVRMQNNQFYAKFIEYDNYINRSFSDIADKQKKRLFSNFESIEDIKTLNIGSTYYDDGISLKINNNEKIRHKGERMTLEPIFDYDLYHLDMDETGEIRSACDARHSTSSVFGHYKWTYKDYTLLLYSVVIQENEDVSLDFSANDIRLLVLDNDGKIVKNMFLTGSVAFGDIYSVSRSLTLKPNGIELKIENGANYLNDIPSYLKLEAVEFISF